MERDTSGSMDVGYTREPGAKGYPALNAPTPQSGPRALAQVTAETPVVERGTWFDTCPGRGAKSEEGRWRSCRRSLAFDG
jgi:hypothetical protein